MVFGLNMYGDIQTLGKEPALEHYRVEFRDAEPNMTK